jgi:hypothetical protein
MIHRIGSNDNARPVPMYMTIGRDAADATQVVATVDTEVDEVRRRQQQATAGDQNAVHDNRVMADEGDAGHQQQQARCRQHQRQRPLMPAITTDQREQRQDAGKHHKAALETIRGEEFQSQKRQQREHKGQ